MAPINTFDSNLRVVTNVNGDLWDNDEFVAQKAHAEHNDQETSDNPWSQSYNPNNEQALQDLYTKQTQIDVDPTISDANKQDLKIKNLDR